MKTLKNFNEFNKLDEGLFSKKDKIKDYLDNNYYVSLDTDKTIPEITNKIYKNDKLIVISKNTDEECSTKEIIADLAKQTNISDELAYDYIVKWQTSKIKLHKDQLRLKNK